MFKAIIIDDEIDIRQGIRKMIQWESQGFTIVGEASNGQEALSLFQAERPSLVLTDIRMPEMDGLELINHIKTLEPDTTVIILSGYNDFSYAREAMKYGVSNYLLKPVDPDEMHRELAVIHQNISERLATRRTEEEKTASLRNLFLLRLTRDGLSVQSSRQEADAFGLLLRYKTMCVCVLELKDYPQLKSEQSPEGLQLIKFAVHNITTEILQQQQCGYLFEETDGRYGLLLGVNSPVSGLHYFHGILVEIEASLRQYAQIHTSIGMGGTVDSPDQLPSSYKQAARALDRKFFSHSESVYPHQEYDVLREISSLHWTEDSLMALILESNKSLIMKELEQLFEEFRENSLSLVAVKYIITNILIGLKKLEAKHGWKDSASSVTDMDAMMQNSSSEEIRQLLTEACMSVSSRLRSEKINKSGNPTDRVLQYIDEHYHEDISLKKLAELFYINQFYLGQLIRKKQGVSFNEYLNRIRIDHALKLLSHGGTSIKEVSEKVGYKYVDHFYKNFKEITGTSPGEFKKNI